MASGYVTSIGNLGGGAQGSTSHIPTQSLVAESTEQLDILISQAHGALSLLSEQLTPAVLTGATQAGNSQVTPKDNPSSQPWVLARSMQQCQQMRQLIERIEDIRQRLVI